MKPPQKAAACFFLGLIGLGLCVYLGWLHLGLLRGELLGGAACGGAGSLFNCHAVTAGRFGSFLSVPLWAWGIAGYCGVIFLSLIAWNFPDAWPDATTLLTGLALFSVSVDTALFVVMVTQVKYLCLFCLLTYLTNALLLIMARLASQQSFMANIKSLGKASATFLPWSRKPYGRIFWVFFLLSAFGGYAVHASTYYVAQGSPALLRGQIQDFVNKEQRSAVAIDGDPMEGPVSAHVTMVEFSDFLCPACQKASRFKPIMLASHRSDIRFVFKHFPLDTSCNDAISRMVHPGACTVAAASECAHLQGKFWPFHDLIFTHGHDYDLSHLQADVQGLGVNMEQYNACMNSGKGMDAVRRDIAQGKQLGIMSTPTFFINGLKMPGIMTPAVFEMLMDLLKNEANP